MGTVCTSHECSLVLHVFSHSMLLARLLSKCHTVDVAWQAKSALCFEGALLGAVSIQHIW